MLPNSAEEGDLQQKLFVRQALGARLRLAGWNAGATPLRTVFHSGCAVCSENRLFSGTLPVT